MRAIGQVVGHNVEELRHITGRLDGFEKMLKLQEHRANTREQEFKAEMEALKLKMLRVEKLVVKSVEWLDAHTKGLIDKDTQLMAEDIKDELFFMMMQHHPDPDIDTFAVDNGHFHLMTLPQSRSSSSLPRHSAARVFV